MLYKLKNKQDQAMKASNNNSYLSQKYLLQLVLCVFFVFVYRQSWCVVVVVCPRTANDSIVVPPPLRRIKNNNKFAKLQ